MTGGAERNRSFCGRRGDRSTCSSHLVAQPGPGHLNPSHIPLSKAKLSQGPDTSVRQLPPSKSQFKTTSAQTPVNHLHQPASSLFHHCRIPHSPQTSWKPQGITCWRLISKSISVYASFSPTITFFSWVLLRRACAKPWPSCTASTYMHFPHISELLPSCRLGPPSAEPSN